VGRECQLYGIFLLRMKSPKEGIQERRKSARASWGRRSGRTRKTGGQKVGGLSGFQEGGIKREGGKLFPPHVGGELKEWRGRCGGVDKFS